MTIDEISKILENDGFKLKGCSLKEISKIESFYEVTLPKGYTDFLQRMGKSAGRFLKGSSAFYDEIFELKDWAVNLLDENNFKPLAENAFVFFMHQGYQFAFFYLNDGDDPPIYYYYEGQNKFDFEKREEKFSDFLTAQLGFLR